MKTRGWVALAAVAAVVAGCSNSRAGQEGVLRERRALPQGRQVPGGDRRIPERAAAGRQVRRGAAEAVRGLHGCGQRRPGASAKPFAPRICCRRTTRRRSGRPPSSCWPASSRTRGHASSRSSIATRRNVEAQLILGNALAGLKDLDGAIREIEEAIKLDPSRGATYSNLAAVRRRRRQRDQAKAAFEKAVEVDPRSIDAWLALAYFRGRPPTPAAPRNRSRAPSPSIRRTRWPTARSPRSTSASIARREAEPYLKTLAATGSPGGGAAARRLLHRHASATTDATAVLQPLTKDTDARGRGRDTAGGDRLRAERQGPRPQPDRRGHHSASPPTRRRCC